MPIKRFIFFLKIVFLYQNKNTIFLISGINKKRLVSFRQSGVTLIELIVFIAVSGIIIISLSTVFRQVMVSLTKPSLDNQLTEMAQYQLNTVLSHRYDENSTNDGIPCDVMVPCAGMGVDAGESLTSLHSLDDVDDFDGFVDIPRPGFTREINVSYTGAEFGIANQYAKRIDVTVASSTIGGSTLTLSAYKVNQ